MRILKLLLLIFNICYCFTIRYNADCNGKVEVIQKVVQIDTAYQCSTFIVNKDTLFFKCDTTKDFPKMITPCKK